MATTSRGRLTRAAIIVAAICCSALAFTACDRLPARDAAPTPSVPPVVTSTVPVSEPTPSIVGTPVSTPPPIAPPSTLPEVVVIHAQTGAVRSFGRIRGGGTLSAENEVVTQILSDQGDYLSLAMGGRAIWLARNASTDSRVPRVPTFTLTLLDGTLVGTWPGSADREPSISRDGRVVLVPSDGGWAIYRGSGAAEITLIPAAAYFVQLSPDGRRVAYLGAGDRPQRATIHVMDLAAGTDDVVDSVTGCQCGAAQRVDWTADGSAVRYWTAVPRADGRGVDLAGRFWPSSANVDLSQPAIPHPAEEAITQPGCGSAWGIEALELHPSVSPSTCRASSRGVLSPLGDRVAYFWGRALIIQDLVSKTAIRADRPLAQSFWYAGPSLQWDPSGAYVVAITDPNRRD